MEKKNRTSTKTGRNVVNGLEMEATGFVKVPHHGTTRLISKEEVTNGLKALLEADTKYRCRFAESDYHVTINKINQVYFELLDHWNKKDLYFDKSYKVLAVSQDNSFWLEVSVEPKNQKIVKEKLIAILKKIQEIEPCSKLYIGQNNPKKPIFPTTTETQLARSIRKMAKEEKVTVVDQLIMSNTEVFSFNDYLEEA